MKYLSFYLLLFLIQNAHALVDYSETNSDRKAINRMSTQSKNSDQSALIWKSDFSLNSSYEVSEIESKKYGFINLNTHIQTPFNIYVDASYWTASISGGNGSQNGNPKFILGFNWIRFGSPSDEAQFNFYGGARLAGKSELASSRTDKIFGVETTKRFGSFGLGIGYDLTLPSAPKKETDMAIGNISKIVLSAGWMVSSDIQFEVEAESYKILKSKESSLLRLEKDVSFSSLSPKLNLILAPAVNFEMGARFRTNRPKSEQDLKRAKLYDLHGAYSNSLFAGLNLAL